MNISISRDGIEIGEWTEEQVHSLYKEGELIATDHYWKEGMSEWKELGNFIKPPPPPSRKATPLIPSLSDMVVESTSPASPPVTPHPVTAPTPDQKYPGIGRIFFLCLTCTIVIIGSFIKVATNASSAGTFNPIDVGVFLVLLAPIKARLTNMGYSGWYALLYFVPLVGGILFCCCLLVPSGYAITKKIDAGTRIGFFGGIALFLCVTALSILILLGTPVKKGFIPSGSSANQNNAAQDAFERTSPASAPVTPTTLTTGSADSAEAASYRVSAEGGDVVAARKLGLLYLVGLGVPKDSTEALKWLRIAASQGDAGAQYGIGYMYQNGQGVEQDYSQALSWYQKAADQGQVLAQNAIGDMYFTGHGLTQDYGQALSWYQKAADQGNVHAQNSIGFMYCDGVGVAKDYSQAFSWYKKAADQGDAISQSDIGWMYENGFGVAKDTTMAVEWYKKAAAQGRSAAQDALKRLGQ